MVFNLSDNPSIIHEYLRQVRDPLIQKDRLRFRKNIERMGELIAYEISKGLSYRDVKIDTGLGACVVKTIDPAPVLMTVLRAGLPFLNGFLNIFENADVGFIGAYRKESEASISIKMDYWAVPPLEEKVLILIDPMLATGKSIVEVLEMLIRKSRPDHVHVASVIAAPEGIDRVTHFFQKNMIRFSIWTAAIDEKLNAQFYIVPGLGDAGDLSYGSK
jgi:uracil phosphoribosyltransferase